VLLCSKHHTLVHEGGFRIEKDYRDRWFFRRPDGLAVPACGYRAADTRDEDVGTEDNRYIVPPSVHTSAEGSRVAEPSAEVYRARGPSAEVFPFTCGIRVAVNRPRSTVTEITVHRLRVMTSPMNIRSGRAAEFEEHRRKLWRIAYPHEKKGA